MIIYLIKLNSGEFFGGYSEHHSLLTRVPKDRPFEARIYIDPEFADQICNQLSDDQGHRVKGKVVPFYFGPLEELEHERVSGRNRESSPSKSRS